MIAVFAAIALIGFASADTAAVAGKIYNSDYSATIPGASVNVTCNGTTHTTTSLADGSYAVTFDSNNFEPCAVGSTVQVGASKDGMSGQSSGIVNDGSNIFLDCNIDFAVVNVALIPEFGILIGTITIMGALVAFFVIRRR